MRRGLLILNRWHFDDVYGGDVFRDLSHRVDWAAPPPQTADAVRRRSEVLRDVELLFTGWGAPVLDKAFLDAAPRLRAVFYAAGTIRGMVTPAFWERQIVVSSAAAVNAVPVAEYTLGAILTYLKQAWRLALDARTQRRMPELSEIPGIPGRTVGLISLGNVGRRVAQHLKRFDLEVLAYDPVCSPAQMRKLKVKPVSLDEIFERSDVVSLHAPLLEATRHLVRGSHFARMKNGATFINTARGSIVHETEMIAVLRRRPELNVLLDVTDPEPPEPDSPLYALPNVALTPHVAGSVGPECRRMGRCMADELERFLANKSLRHEVTQEKAAFFA